MRFLLALLLAAIVPHQATARFERETVASDDLVPVPSWPAHLPAASKIFQCAPTRVLRGDESIAVWTTTSGRVLAVAPAVGLTLPPYAVALVSKVWGSPADAVRTAAHGFQVAQHRKAATLPLAESVLLCLPSADD